MVLLDVYMQVSRIISQVYWWLLPFQVAGQHACCIMDGSPAYAVMPIKYGRYDIAKDLPPPVQS